MSQFIAPLIPSTMEVYNTMDMALAKEIGDILDGAYTGWLWHVQIRGGVVVVKNLNISSTHGFVLKYQNIKGDAEARKRAVTWAGGELLERCHLPRGPRQLGAAPQVFEGASKWRKAY